MAAAALPARIKASPRSLRNAGWRSARLALSAAAASSWLACILCLGAQGLQSGSQNNRNGYALGSDQRSDQHKRTIRRHGSKRRHAHAHHTHDLTLATRSSTAPDTPFCSTCCTRGAQHLLLAPILAYLDLAARARRQVTRLQRRELDRHRPHGCAPRRRRRLERRLAARGHPRLLMRCLAACTMWVRCGWSGLAAAAARCTAALNRAGTP